MYTHSMDQAAHALARFGLGAKAGEQPPADPHGWLLGQLGPADPVAFTGVPDTTAALILLRQERALQKSDPAEAERQKLTAHAMHADAATQLDAALASAAPLRERLVWFWANHFTVSTRRGGDAGLIGPFIREAIRPHVTGRFDDMLLAVMRHPAMLMYLDNAGSTGPNSVAGRRRHVGLNENLGRESLELHTVTPAAGYSQADVTAYAALLTGWSVDMASETPGFRFRPEMHEPGRKYMLGQSFAEGEAGGVAALSFLAHHPATFAALATALARHFCADTPAAQTVARIAAVLRRTGGDLSAAMTALVAEPAAWQPLVKLRTPFDYTLAVLRALGPMPTDPANLIGVLASLGQGVWAAPLPNGWPDRAADWADPETLLRRADWAYRVSGRAAQAEPSVIAAASLGGSLAAATAAAIAHAGSRRDALTLLFTSPAFMRR